MRERTGSTAILHPPEHKVGLKRVCLLGHEPSTVKALGTLLGKEFYLIVAENADKFLSVLHSGAELDGLILETQFLELNGAKLIETLRSEERQLPIFVFTSSDDVSLRFEISSLSVNGFFRKPNDIWRLAETLHRELGPTREGRGTSAIGTRANAVVAGAIEYIEENLTSISSSTDVSKHLEVTREHLSRQFTKYTGQTLWDFITKCRVEKAKEMLKDRGLLVKQIFREVGFNCESSFFRAFIKYTGLTPERYRRAMGN